MEKSEKNDNGGEVNPDKVPARTERREDIPGPDLFDMTMAIPKELIGSAPDRLLEPALQIQMEKGWERYPLKGREVSIGHIRQPDNHIALPDQQVSRRHAKILFDKPTGAYFFLDNGSTNGSTVNGIPIIPHEPVKLANNDVIVVGETRITVYLP
ncbi:MAG: FHA domain-containing protein [Nitrospinae bacterium]|nr:FHA domain-containing protein [Nitrospinota bacterium]